MSVSYKRDRLVRTSYFPTASHMSVYIKMYMYMYVCVCIYIYTVEHNMPYEALDES